MLKHCPKDKLVMGTDAPYQYITEDFAGRQIIENLEIIHKYTAKQLEDEFRNESFSI